MTTPSAKAAVKGRGPINDRDAPGPDTHSQTSIAPDEGASRTGRRAYPLVIWMLLGGNLLVRSAGFAYPFLAYHVAGRGHLAGVVGAVLAAFGLGWIVGQLLCGWLVDRVGGRTTLVATMLVAAMVLVLMAHAHSVLALLVGAAVVGVVYDAPRPVLGATIADLVPDPQRRARVDAWRYSWTNIGAAIAGAVGGLLAELVGTPVLYWVNGIACALFAVLAACCIPSLESRPAAKGGSGYLQALSDLRLVLLFVSSMATLTALMSFLAATPLLMAACGLGAGAYGWTMLANAVTVVILTPVMTPWLSKQVEHNPRLDILAVSAVWTTMCMGAAALADTTLGFSLAAAATAPGEIAWFVVGAGLVHRIAPPEHRGRYHGIWSMALAAAAVISPILASYSLIHGGRLLVAVSTVTVGLIGAVLYLPLARVLACSDETPMMAEEPT